MCGIIYVNCGSVRPVMRPRGLQKAQNYGTMEKSAAAHGVSIMKKAIKITAITLLTVIIALLAAAICYVVYVAVQYYRIDDNQTLQIDSGQTVAQAMTGERYSIVTYNIGFGAYSPEYSFFMDSGVMEDGTEVTGKYSKGLSEQDVQKNTDGAVSVLNEQNADFVFVQEADTDGDRSYHIDQVQALRAQLQGDMTYAENFHTAYLLYPFNDPNGKNNAGIVTFSKVKITSSVRRSYPVDTGFAKFFDLDRCFSVNRISVQGGKELVLINSHMSAYDDGGTIRARQLEMLCGVMKEEYAKGNYVIVGGDFNHELADSFGTFPSTQKQPAWAYPLTNENLPEHFTIAASKEGTGTCRAAEIPYTPGVNYLTVLDGFIVSDNVSVELVRNIDTGFAYSDHNPVRMEFVLM